MSRTRRDRGTPGRAILALLILAALIWWAGHDPHGAAALARHVGHGIAAAARHLRHTRRPR